MKEVWKRLKRFPMYEISTEGKIKSYWYDHINGRPMRIILAYHGKDKYFRVTLRVHSKAHILRVHRLLAETFIPNPNNYRLVSHKDGNNLNNSLDNLYWTSDSDREKLAYRMGRKHSNANYYKQRRRKLWGRVSERFKELVLKTSSREARVFESHPFRSGELLKR